MLPGCVSLIRKYIVDVRCRVPIIFHSLIGSNELNHLDYRWFSCCVIYLIEDALSTAAESLSIEVNKIGLIENRSLEDSIKISAD